MLSLLYTNKADISHRSAVTDSSRVEDGACVLSNFAIFQLWRCCHASWSPATKLQLDLECALATLWAVAALLQPLQSVLFRHCTFAALKSLSTLAQIKFCAAGKLTLYNIL